MKSMKDVLYRYIDLNKCNPELCGEGQLREQIKASII